VGFKRLIDSKSNALICQNSNHIIFTIFRDLFCSAHSVSGRYNTVVTLITISLNTLKNSGKYKNNLLAFKTRVIGPRTVFVCFVFPSE